MTNYCPMFVLFSILCLYKFECIIMICLSENVYYCVNFALTYVCCLLFVKTMVTLKYKPAMRKVLYQNIILTQDNRNMKKI